MTKKKKIILVIVLLLLVTVIVGIFTLPFPRRIQKTMRGAFVVDGKAGAEVEFTLDGWYYDYLVRDDRIYVEFDFTGEEAMGLYNFTGSPVMRQLSDEYLYASFIAYSPALKRHTGFSYGLLNDFSACIIRNENFICIGSENGEKTPEELITVFQYLLEE